MSLKKSIKKFIKNQGNDSLPGRVYLYAVNKKRKNRYEKYAHEPVDEKLMVFESFMGRKCTDSPKAIYDFLRTDERYADFRFVWCFRDSVMDELGKIAEDPRTDTVRWGSEEYYEIYARAGYWFTNTRIPGAIGRRDGQVYTQCWHGTPLKRLGCDIDTEATESRQTTKKVIHSDAGRYSYLLSPSPFYSEKMSSAFDLKALGKENVILECGYPRNDSLYRYTEEEVTRIRKQLGIPENKKVILYAPTYRENLRNSDRKYTYSEPVDFSRLRDKLGEEYVVLFRAHYFIAQEFDFSKYSGFVIDVSDHPEINDLYIVSDILVTDYSSVFFDYGILKRPVILYMYDLEFYRDELRGFYLDISSLPWPVAVKQDELEELIRSSDEWSDLRKQEIEQFVKTYAPYEDGNSARRAVESIVKNG